ncbi:hypothetical protein S83_016386 [Arachis hypogaea]
MSQPTPTQELVAKDLHGYEWRFKHIFRGKGHNEFSFEFYGFLFFASNLFIVSLTRSSTQALHHNWMEYFNFVASKRLVAGNTFVFSRGHNGELHVGLRHNTPQPSSMPSSVISSQSMHLGVLATASHAVATQTLFVVYYKPR